VAPLIVRRENRICKMRTLARFVWKTISRLRRKPEPSEDSPVDAIVRLLNDELLRHPQASAMSRPHKPAEEQNK
jgi:hypothetical protein